MKTKRKKILNEFAIRNRDYKENKKAYDAAFAKGIAEWEKGRAKRKGLVPGNIKDAIKYFTEIAGEDDKAFNDKMKEMFKNLNATKVGKWTVLFGNYDSKNDKYSKEGKVNTCYVVAKDTKGKGVTKLRKFSFKRYIKWDKNVSEAVLNEFAIRNRDYKENKKAYDAAFAKGIAEWEKTKAAKKGFKPATVSEFIKAVKEGDPELLPDMKNMIKGINTTKVGKWTVLFGNFDSKNKTYHKEGKVNVSYVIARQDEGRLPVKCRKFPFKRYIKWDSDK